MAKLKHLLFVFFSLLLIYSCDSKESQPATDTVKPDIELTSDRALDSAQKIAWNTFYVQQYEKNGEPYTGTQTYYYEDEDAQGKPFLIRTFDNGLLQHEEAFHKNGEKVGQTEYEYQDAQIVKVTSYFPDGNKRSETIRPSSANNSLGMVKEWFENGQLKFEVNIDQDNKYAGRMTLYDEEGNIVKQQEY
jgi:antitoxin component YwqK of YwqJK toxin-antitoxin module